MVPEEYLAEKHTVRHTECPRMIIKDGLWAASAYSCDYSKIFQLEFLQKIESLFRHVDPDLGIVEEGWDAG